MIDSRRNPSRARWLLAALCLVAASLASASSATDAALEGLDDYIERVRRDWDVPGIAVGIVRNDTVIFAKAYGAREIGKAPPLDTRSLFEIGSLTKAMTATALALLVDEGRIGWDDRVVEHLPSFRLADPWVTAHVTVRDLIANRVGYEGGTEVIVPMTSAEVLARASTLRPVMPYRDSMLYSNSLYSIAGELVAAVSGMTWAEFVEQRVFAPLRMQSTFASVDTAQLWKPEHLAPSMYGQAPSGPVGIEQALHDNVSMPHWHTPGGVKALPWQISLRGGAAAGSAVSNLDDLLLWTRWHLSGGAPLLRPATFRELHTPQALIRESPSSSFEDTWNAVEKVSPSRERPAYALGWFVNSFRGHRYINHGGALLGALSLIAMIPEQDIGVVVLANSYGRGGHGLMNEAIALRIFDALLGAGPHDWNQDLLQAAQRAERADEQYEADLQRARLKRLRPSLPLDDYTGEYRNAQLGQVRIERVGKELFLHLPGAFRWRLEHWHGDVFRLHVSTAGQDLMRFFVTFNLGPQGRVASVDPGWVLLGGSLQPIR
jgi:CubicO group peptidase (beta-lactamase class C family)